MNQFFIKSWLKIFIFCRLDSAVTIFPLFPIHHTQTCSHIKNYLSGATLKNVKVWQESISKYMLLYVCVCVCVFLVYLVYLFSSL